MNIKINSSVQYLIVIFFASLIFFFSQRGAPLFTDGEVYALMSRGIWASKDLVTLPFWQRLLPVFIAGSIGDLFSLNSEKSFYFSAGLVFIILVTTLYYYMRREIQDSFIAFSLTGLLIIAFWPITYNLWNVYQLCDLLTYMLVLGMLIAFRTKNSTMFFIFGLLGVFTRQNLWVLALSAYAYLIFESFLKVGIKKIEKTLITQFLVIAGCIAVMNFAIKGVAVGNYINTKPYNEHFYIKSYIVGFFKMSSPFWPIFLFRGKKIFKDIIRYSPFFLFMFVSIIIPLNFILKAPAEDFTFVERVGYQGLWPFLVLASIYLGKELKLILKNFSYLSIILILLYGVAHLYLTKSFSPLFIFPSYFRYLFVPALFFITMVLKLKREKANYDHA